MDGYSYELFVQNEPNKDRKYRPRPYFTMFHLQNHLTCFD